MVRLLIPWLLFFNAIGLCLLCITACAQLPVGSKLAFRMCAVDQAQWIYLDPPPENHADLIVVAKEFWRPPESEEQNLQFWFADREGKLMLCINQRKRVGSSLKSHCGAWTLEFSFDNDKWVPNELARLTVCG